MKTFEELGVIAPILRAVEELGFTHPMPVQEQVIPYLLDSTKDVIALAQTGTGKTAAFGIPLLQRIDASNNMTQAVVLSPTRELCLQICDDLRAFSKFMSGTRVLAVYGGASIVQQMKELRKGAQIIVATPGRLIDLMNRGVAKLDQVKNIVLDEADEMLNMGFSESIDAILEGVPDDRNTLLFSATMSREIEKIARNYLKEYEEIVVGSRNEGAENVNHVYYLVNAKDKYLALKRIVDYYPRIYGIVFCRTKKETQEIADKLIKDGYNAESLHGDLSQPQRDQTMQKFRQHLTQLLVATDVAARGLDVDELTHVINFGLPDDIENYTHRSGRTGRAGRKGTSISIIHTRERHKVKAIEREIGRQFVDGVLPTAHEICTKQLYKVIDEIEKADVLEDEIAPFMADISRHFEYMDKDDLVKKLVSLEFGRFLAYYADAPEIERPATEKGRNKRERGEKTAKEKRQHKPEKGYTRLFINLGKDDGFYPGEIMQFLNKHMRERQEVGQIDLLGKFSYIEVPDRNAQRVMKALNGKYYKNREVRCNEANERGDEVLSGKKNARHKRFSNDETHGRNDRKQAQKGKAGSQKMKKEDWMKFLNNEFGTKSSKQANFDDLEEGFARRKSKKKR